ncbi:MAG: Na/Pi symporter [Negativicutes bacterium]|nr:Na/Pi symporter [Negativicutes bacterium]
MEYLALITGGTGLLLGGLFLMRFGLARLMSRSWRQLLVRLTLTPWRGLIAGTIAAALMQSSTAVTLLTIGLVSAEYLPFYQSLGIILGANIGTCSTAGLLTLSLPPRLLLPFAAVSGLTALFYPRRRYLALSLLGMLCMLAGVGLLSQGVEAIAELDTAISYLSTAGSNPAYGVIGGILLTFLVQSSSAATGLLMVLTDEGVIDLTTAIYGVYGNNIGSCLFSLLVSLTAPLAARRVAVAHILLNLLGVAVFLPLSALMGNIVGLITTDPAAQVAAVHTLFNLLSSLAVLPVIGLFARLIAFLVPARSGRR